MALSAVSLRKQTPSSQQANSFNMKKSHLIHRAKVGSVAGLKRSTFVLLSLIASLCHAGEIVSPPPASLKEFDPPLLTIAMWDFSWLNGHHHGGWAEDFEKITDQLIERKFNTVRIDAFPLIIHDLVQKGETEYLIKAAPYETWGFSLIEHRQNVVAELKSFMSITKRKGLRVILSSWGIGSNDSYADPARFRAAWETTLDLLEKDGLLDHVAYVDFDQEFPYFSPFQKQLNQLGKVKAPAPGGQAGAMEQAGIGGGAWNAAQRVFVKDFFESTLAHFHRKYPKLRFTFSLTAFWPEVRSLKVQGLDVLELHVWIRNQLNDFTGFNKLPKDRKSDRDYKKYMTGIHEAMKHRDELVAHMKSQMTTARDWAAELGVPLTTTEAWGPWWHMDHPDLEWQWLADWCETCMALAPEYGFRGVTPWNYSHPYWENWKNIGWYRRINNRFLDGAKGTTR